MTGDVGTVVLMVRFNAADAALEAPAATSTAVRLTPKKPVPRTGVVKVQTPLALTAPVPSRVVPLKTSTAVLGAAVPVNVSTLASVILGLPVRRPVSGENEVITGTCTDISQLPQYLSKLK